MRRMIFIVALMTALLAGCSGSGGGGDAAKGAGQTAGTAAGASDQYAATNQAIAEVEASLAVLVDDPELNEADADQF